MSLLAASGLGLALGLRHALEADHIAAVCALVTRDGSVARAARSGALWGTGHGAVIALAGGALVATGASVPGPIAAALDAAVAVMLVVLGVAAFRSSPTSHGHSHGHSQHSQRARRPLWVGVIHGASGTAALTLLVAKTIPERSEALAFVLIFGAASVLGMALAAALLAWPLREAARNAPAFARGLTRVAGVASIAAGLAVAWTTLSGAPEPPPSLSSAAAID